MNQPKPPGPGEHAASPKTSQNFQPVLATLALFTGASVASAQIVPGAADQLNNTQQRRLLEEVTRVDEPTNSAPELYPGESDDVGPQSVIAIKPPPYVVEATADTQYYYSDNMLMDNSARLSGGVLVSSLQAALATTPLKLGGGTLVGRIGLRQQWYNFIEFESHSPNVNSYDFDAQTAYIEGRWFYGNWILGAGFDATRLVSPSLSDQFYTEYVPRYEATRLFKFDKDQTVTLTYQGYYHESDSPAFPEALPSLSSGVFNRLDQFFMATYIWQPCEHARLQPYYSLRYTHFTSSIHRDDTLHSVGVAAYWFINEYLTARGFTSYDERFSSVINGGYHQVSAGLGMNLEFRF